LKCNSALPAKYCAATKTLRHIVSATLCAQISAKRRAAMFDLPGEFNLNTEEKRIFVAVRGVC
jgi:hypothetical protein